MTTLETEKPAALADAGEHKTALPTASSSDADAVPDVPMENDATAAADDVEFVDAVEDVDAMEAVETVETKDPEPAAGEPSSDPPLPVNSTPKFDRPESPDTQQDDPSLVPEHAPSSPAPSEKSPEADVSPQAAPELATKATKAPEADDDVQAAPELTTKAPETDDVPQPTPELAMKIPEVDDDAKPTPELATKAPETDDVPQPTPELTTKAPEADEVPQAQAAPEPAKKAPEADAVQQPTPEPARKATETDDGPQAAPELTTKAPEADGVPQPTPELAATTPDDVNGTVAPPTTLSRLPSSLSSNSMDDQDISTIPDPRLRLQREASGEKNPEAADEITALSTKLIDAINYQSTLDDTLSRTRMQLEEAQERARQLEGLVARQKEFLAGGLWVRKSTVEEEKAKVNAKAREERRLRLEAEAAKTKMELELETLTAELFLQANKMVTTAKEEARAEQIEAQRRYDSLKGQLADTEGLLRSQQEQLAELKQFMEEMIANEGIARDDQTTALTTPTTPEFGQDDFIDPDAQPSSDKNTDVSMDKDTLDSDEAADRASVRASSSTVAMPASTTATPALNRISSPDLAPPSPSQPMSFTHLLRPVLRYDTNAFHEFVDLVRTAQIQLMLQQQMQQVHSRSPSSTSLPKTPPMATMGWNGQLSTQVASSASSVVSLSAISSLANVASGLNASSGGNPTQNHTKELKETKFYKRVVVEDIEPTLRLDTAPGISWLVRRNIMTAVLEGTLVAEPVPSTNGTNGTNLLTNPCSMCGESRRQPEFLRQHRFRLTESDKSTPYPLCGYCLSRVRSVCGFLVFLRMIKEGHWRAPDEASEQAAWEECVRLREHMFWARIGGGVLPAVGVGSGGHHGGFGVPRQSRASGGGSTRNSMIFHANGGGVSSGRPSLELPSQPNTPTKISVIGSPLASPPLSPNHPGLGIGANDRVSANAPNRPSKLSVSMASGVNGLGSHVP